MSGSLLDGLAMYLSRDTTKFHDNEGTHILHINFWTSTHRGEASPLAAPLSSAPNFTPVRDSGYRVRPFRVDCTLSAGQDGRRRRHVGDVISRPDYPRQRHRQQRLYAHTESNAILSRNTRCSAYSKRVPRTNCALRIKKCHPGFPVAFIF